MRWVLVLAVVVAACSTSPQGVLDDLADAGLVEPWGECTELVVGQGGACGRSGDEPVIVWPMNDDTAAHYASMSEDAVICGSGWVVTTRDRRAGEAIADHLGLTVGDC